MAPISTSTPTCRREQSEGEAPVSGMRLEIRYVTDFQYPERVRESHNVLRARPATDVNQRLISYRATVHPTARGFSYVD